MADPGVQARLDSTLGGKSIVVPPELEEKMKNNAAIVADAPEKTKTPPPTFMLYAFFTMFCKETPIITKIRTKVLINTPPFNFITDNFTTKLSFFQYPA